MYDINKIIKIINKDLGIRTYNFDHNFYNSYINKMYEYYKGYVPSIHSYKDYNGVEVITIDKVRLNMGKHICEDHASLTFNENVSINVEGNAEQEFLLGHDEMTGILGLNNFWTIGPRMYELTAALGTTAMEIVIDKLSKMGDNRILANDFTELKINTYDAFDILPLSWDNNMNITEVGFLSSKTIKDTQFINLRLHVLEDEKYVIYNKNIKVDKSNNYSLIQLDEKDGLLDRIETGSNLPWFSILKLPIVNNYDIYSPFGASVLSNALDIIRTIDEAFNILHNEFYLGNKKVFYSKRLLNRRDDGTLDIPDKFNKQVFYYTGDDLGSNDEDKSPIHEFNPNLRVSEITEGIQNSLNYLSTLTGLGSNFYKFDNNGLKTATEVVSENSNMYRTIRKNEMALEKFILDLLKSILYVGNYIFHKNFNIDTNISINFDTSIIEDKTAIRERDLKEVDLGIMSIEEYREKWYNSNRRDTSKVNLNKE